MLSANRSYSLMRILLFSDERKNGSFIARALRENAYAVDVADGAEHTSQVTEVASYDVVVLDLLDPIRNIQICRDLRRCGYSRSIMILTPNSLEQRVHGLQAGADDCLTKPFKLVEFLARIQALLRRAFTKPLGSLNYADLELDCRYRTAKRGNSAVPLTSKEFALLELLLLRASETVPRCEIVEHVWDLQFDTGTNVVAVHMNHLRQKIDRDHPIKLIHTVRGVGYRLGPPQYAE